MGEEGRVEGGLAVDTIFLLMLPYKYDNEGGGRRSRSTVF